MFNNLSPKNIPQLKAAIEAYGTVWFHGCGNMYADEKASDDRQKYSNPNSEESTYRIKLTNVSQVPETVEGLVKKLLVSRNQEMVSGKSATVAGIKTISTKSEDSATNIQKPDALVPESVAPEKTQEQKDQEEFEKLLAEEKNGK